MGVVMTSKRVQVSTTLPYLAVIPLIILGILSILATGGVGGGGAAPAPAPQTFTVGGTVPVLSGSGLVLQNNGGDALPISGNGAFAFATALADATAYNVTVLTQPTNPTQTCTVTNGSGTLSGANVTNISVSCPPVPSGMIDRTKWADLEFVRQIGNPALESALTRFGSAGGNTLEFIDPAAVTAYQADVTVTAVSNTNAIPRARLRGVFYNDGTPGSGNVGDVFADIEIRHNGTQLVVAFIVFLCSDFNCNNGTDLFFDDTTFGSVAVGETHTLSLAWDGALFTFGFDGATTTFDPTVAAPVDGPAGGPFNGIGTRVSGIGGPGEGAFIAVTFDNVVVIFGP